MAAFGIWQKVAMKLLASEVLWPLSSNCRPWRFYGHFWEMKERDTKFGILTSSLSQYSDSALFCDPALLFLTIPGLRFGYGLFNDWSLTPWHGNTCHIWHLLSSVTGSRYAYPLHRSYLSNHSVCESICFPSQNSYIASSLGVGGGVIGCVGGCARCGVKRCVEECAIKFPEPGRDSCLILQLHLIQFSLK